jgi:hypothetical protein
MTCACGGAGAPFGINDCDCCTGVSQQTPEAVTNRPALGQIGYRAGRYATFLASMLASLSGADYAALWPLRTRDPADFTIALTDSWAVVLDILTFYTERLANEAFLRTALDQRSVTELAALVGYAPSPGVAASATLAFTLSTTPGSPPSALIPAGTRVQSVPGPGQTAQVFETSADLTAVASWNALPAQTTVPWALSGTESATWIAGTANNVSVGDALLFVAAPGGQPTAAGPSELHYVTAVTVDHAAGSTQVSWEAPLVTTDFAAGAHLYAFRKKAALYGATAPNPQTLGGPNIINVTGWPSATGTSFPQRWNYATQYVTGSSQASLDASYPGLTPAAGGPPQWLVLTGPAQALTALSVQATSTIAAVFQITAAQDTSPDYYTVTSKTTELTVASPQLLADGAWVQLGGLAIDDILTAYIGDTPDVTAYVQSAQLTPAPLPLTTWNLGATYPGPGLPGMLAPVSGSAVTVIGGQQIAAGQPIGVSGKRLRLQVPAGAGASFVPARASAGTTAADGQVFLVDSFPPGADTLGNALWSVTTVSGVPGTLTIPGAGAAPAFLPADAADPVAGEAATVQSAGPSGDVTALTLAAPLSRVYDADTVRVNANAVLATHGETVQEILGSGDASNGALALTLKQGPVTYLTSTLSSGAQSTLQVWANNLRWHETGSLLTAGPADRVFVTSVNPAGNQVVRFGDGTRGGRPPTGQANIRAVYRKGIGSAGMVGAGQLSQPLDRPQGLSSVTNPSRASGAADPATAAEIRASTPLPTLTIGRVVSLEDYQNYALGFAGIAKALATLTWLGNVRGVFLTVAGAGGSVIGAGDPVITSLIASLRLYGDPQEPLRVASCVPVLFTFGAGVAVDTANYDTAQVLGQVWQDLSAAFAFGLRSLGQGVAASEIIEIVQSVPGVKAVRLTGLARTGQTATGSPVLRASGPQPPAGAELLLLDPATQGQIGAWS